MFCTIILTACAVEESQKIKVGVISPLTGDFASYGSDVQRGIALALEENDFKDVKVIYEDACLPKEASTAINKLVQVDNVDLISGVFCIISVEPILALADQDDINVMMVASVPDAFVGISEDLFSAHFAIKDEAIAQAEFAYNYLGARKGAILFLDNPFGISYKNNFAKRFEELGGNIVSTEALDVYKGDFRTPITKVKTASPDVVLVVHLGNELGLILKQAKELGVDAKFIGTYEAEDISVINAGGAATEGLWISSPKMLEQGKVSDFTKRFNQKYGAAPTAISRNAYDAVKLQINAYKQCAGDKKCIRTTIGSTKNYDGASGKFSISANGTAVKEIIFKQVQNGTFQLIDSVN